MEYVHRKKIHLQIKRRVLEIWEWPTSDLDYGFFYNPNKIWLHLQPDQIYLLGRNSLKAARTKENELVENYFQKSFKTSLKLKKKLKIVWKIPFNVKFAYSTGKFGKSR